MEADGAGTYKVTFKAADAYGGSVEYTMTINVTDPAAVITLPPSPKCIDGYNSEYTFDACDPQGTAVTVTVEVTVDGKTDVLTPTKVENTTCTYTVTIPCKDGMSVVVKANDGNQTTSSNFTINVNFNTAPSKPVVVKPGDMEIVATLVVEFNNSEDKTTTPSNPTTYDCIACDKPDCSGAVIKVENVTESSTGTTTCEFPVDQLVEDTTYTVTVVAKDGLDPTNLTNTSDKVTVLFSQQNDAPPVPTLNFPADKGVVDSLLPSLKVNNVKDPEGDVVTYVIEIATDMAFTNIVETLANLPEGTIDGTTSGTMSVSLTEDGMYYWRAKAVDENAAESGWSDVWSFTVNTTNQLPTAPVLSSPNDGEKVATKTPQICWTNSDDGDKDTLTYTVEIGTDNTFNSQATGYYKKTGVAADASGTTCYTLETVLVENSTYYVRVTANDGTGDGPASTPRSFTVNEVNDAPTAPALLAPSEAQVLLTVKDFTFEWKLSTDADDDELTYTLFILSSAEKTSILKKYEGLKPSDVASGKMGYKMTEELAAGTYYWYVQVTDGTETVDSATVGKFTVDPSGTGGTGTGGSKKSGGGCTVVEEARRRSAPSPSSCSSPRRSSSCADVARTNPGAPGRYRRPGSVPAHLMNQSAAHSRSIPLCAATS